MMKALVTAGLLVAALLSGVAGRAQAAGPVGWLDVASEPSAEIFIDDTDTHKMTPQSQLALEPGHHMLKLVTADGSRHRNLGFKIESGKTTKLSFTLLP
jgi:hypothetical protein